MRQIIFDTKTSDDMSTLLNKDATLISNEGISVDELKLVIRHITEPKESIKTVYGHIDQIIPHNNELGHKHYLILWRAIIV